MGIDARVAWIASECQIRRERVVESLIALARDTRRLADRMLELGVPSVIVERSSDARDRAQKELMELK